MISNTDDIIKTMDAGPDLGYTNSITNYRFGEETDCQLGKLTNSKD